MSVFFGILLAAAILGFVRGVMFLTSANSKLSWRIKVGVDTAFGFAAWALIPSFMVAALYQAPS
jgi:hypothetical protein